MKRQQFRILYREFLFRMVDLEILAPQGEMDKLLGQFAALLIFVSLWLSFVACMMSAGRTNPGAGLLIAWVAGHFLIATTMLAVGLFAVMSWDSTFPNRRDVLVLFPLPIRARTLLLAKVAAVATSLGITVLSLNVFTGIIAPVASSSAIGVVPLARSFAAYWIATFGAGVFIFCGVLTMQGLAQLLPRQTFLRISSFLQMGFFVVLLTVYFLQPPFSDAADLLRNQRVLYWVPSYWFFGLFQQLAGPTLPGAGMLAGRALMDSIPRPGRFSLFPSRLSGFTRQRRRKVQFDLDILLLVVLEIHGLLASPSRSGLQPPFPAWPIRCSASRHVECLTSLADVTT